MWIIDPRVGLLSVVVADDPITGRPSADRIMIRSRRTRHLENLITICPALAGAKIEAGREDLDYPVRLVVDRAVFVEVMAELGRSLRHRNVKSAAHANEKALGSDFVAAMHRVHAALARIRDEPAD